MIILDINTVEVFFIFLEILINILFCLKRIFLRYCMHLYKQINSLFDHFLKYSSLGDMLIYFLLAHTFSA